MRSFFFEDTILVLLSSFALVEIDRDSKHNELANAITHGVGACLAIAALAILVVFASLKGNVWHVVSFSVFGSTLVLL